MAGDSGMAPSRRDDSPDTLAADTVRLAVSRAISGSYFLSQAAGMLTPQPSSGLGAPFATDGRTLWYDPECILLDLGRTREPPVRDYVHVLAHCLLLHPFMGGEVAKDPAAWQLACDIAAERIVAEVCGPRPGERGQAQGVVLSRLARDLGEPLTAERVYRALREGGYRASRRSWQRVFRCDDASGWLAGASRGRASGSSDDGGGEARATGAQGNPAGSGGTPSPGASGRMRHGDGGPDAHGTGDGDGRRPLSPRERDELRRRWEHVAKSTAVDLRTLSRGRGQGLGDLECQIEAATRHRASYADFLRRFAREREEMRVSPDEFDYAFYELGLSLYGNMPLIESLEYRERRTLHDFVVVIDTSASVSPSMVRRFVDLTFGMLRDGGAMGDRTNVHVVMTDAGVRSDVCLSSEDDLRRWQREVRVVGGGGTDFRPAFDYVDRLRREGGLRDLSGLVYLTDGWGIYPSRVPDYRVAFVFYDRDFPAASVPPWAIKVVLDPDELGAGEDEAQGGAR